ncbi:MULTISPECIES: TetR/AcrR family transcriptional regulator [Ensifer]|jgi:AcrR family transcriptional regulator|uniref:TetR/AcrR family transcriptional regulator n=1 Tax=Ensifer adhaerens TaxID=106592 RepID=A0ABY8HSI8_ENSAD|nr:MULTISPECIES: TetR/AcrR family transcriptional regulator [Ensifer]WFP95076.1 TetR/AcrR family transcriptional regulator [Ensifer adhaerens]
MIVKQHSLTIAVKHYLMTVMKPKKSPGGGRPREFDRDAALETAMRLFWRHGYEGVSFQQLTAAMGVAAPSLYAAFGNKSALYLEAVDRYRSLRGATDLSFMDVYETADDAVLALLIATAHGLSDPSTEAGCMLNMGMLTSHPDHAEIAAQLSERRTAFTALLAGKLQRWLDEEAAADRAVYLSAVIQGMAVQARDGAGRERLEGLARLAAKAIS